MYLIHYVYILLWTIAQMLHGVTEPAYHRKLEKSFIFNVMLYYSIQVFEAHNLGNQMPYILEISYEHRLIMYVSTKRVLY